jgi:hypothetical protein
MKNQNNTPNNNTIELNKDQDGVIKYLIDTGYADYAAKAFGQYTTTDEHTITITTNLKQSIQTNIQTKFRMTVNRFNTYLKDKPLEKLGNNVSDYKNITVRGSKGNDFCRLKVSPIGRYIVEKNIQLYKLDKSEYYIKKEDYSDFENYKNNINKNKRIKIQQAA